MTIPQQIMTGVGGLIRQSGREVFTRKDIRNQLGVESHLWKNSYNPTFQGMRIDEPGGAPDLGERFQGVFRRVSHGKYQLTDYGNKLLSEF
ncbi:MAG: hypothetical protein ABI700_01145 [Chloroflexota bacterium]